MPSWPLRHLDCDVNAFVSPVTRSELNKFGQMQELRNDNYSEIKLYSIFHMGYKVNEFSTNKKEPTITSRSQNWNDNEAATDHGGFVHKANIPLSRRLDRCDRVIQNESDDSIGDNV